MAQDTLLREETLTQPLGLPARPLTLAMSIGGEEARRDLPRLGMYGLGVELTDFIAVPVWLGDYLTPAKQWADALRDFPGGKCLHGAFIDLTPGAQEPELVAFARRRHQQSLEVAATIGCDMMVVHSDFLAREALPVRATERAARLTEYFGALAAAAAPYGITVVVENIRDAQPEPLVALARAIDAPNLGLSLDVGHANLYSALSLDQWVLGLQPYLRHVHLHDNEGLFDRHWGLGLGTMNFRAFFQAVSALDYAPRVTIEVQPRREAWQTLETIIAEGWYTPPARWTKAPRNGLPSLQTEK